MIADAERAVEHRAGGDGVGRCRVELEGAVVVGVVAHSRS